MKDQVSAANAQYTRLAERGGMSPTNSTSLKWETKWPIKPDVVFEGGNGAKDANSAVVLPEMELLSTAGDTAGGPLLSCSGTSPATALAARMAVQIQSEYPGYWPETIRALMVHSAEWTPTMVQSIDANLTRKERYIHLARRVGFGVPDLERALYCAAQRATMVAQASLQPYRKDKSGDPKLNEMNLYALPWPGEPFRNFSGLTIRLRVTLSYFIEPNPPKVRTVNSNYNYAGCALRFAISKLGQTRRAFEAEINVLADADDSQAEADPGDNLRWRFGQKARSKGSLHCDVWESIAQQWSNHTQQHPSKKGITPGARLSVPWPACLLLVLWAYRCQVASAGPVVVDTSDDRRLAIALSHHYNSPSVRSLPA